MRGSYDIRVGHVIDVLKAMPERSVQCVVTSPPYFGLRDYGIEPVVWGGDAGCGHEWGNEKIIKQTPQHLDVLGRKPGMKGGGHKRSSDNMNMQASTGQFCRHCPAWRGSLGLEPTLELFIEHIVEVFREVRRVLRDDGVCYVNMGDSYAQNSSRQTTQEADAEKAKGWFGDERGRYPTRPSGQDRAGNTAVAGLKPKDLCGIPWRVALAMQANGWWWRSTIIWHKPNPMPGSQRDRPTTDFEPVLMFTKRARYFYDLEAVREPFSETAPGWLDSGPGATCYSTEGVPDDKVKPSSNLASRPNGSGRAPRTVWTIPTQPFSGVVSYGSYRIGSLDCPIHGCLSCLASALLCGGLRVASVNLHNLDIDARPELVQEGAVYAIASDRLASLSDVSVAISHSNEIRRMAEQLVRRATSDGKWETCIAYTQGLPHSCATSDRILANNTLASCGPGVQGLRLLGETNGHILGICTFEPPIAGCRCKYIGKIEKRQDHYASYPIELASRCIKSATSEKGACAECGAPWERVVEDSTGGSIGESWHSHEDDGKLGQRTNDEAKGANYLLSLIHI